MSTAQHAVRERIAAVAAAMVEGQIDLLEGCRTIVRLRGSLLEPELYDPELLFLVAVESDLDDVPSESARQHWAPEALAQKDTRKAGYLQSASQDILGACRSLMTRWGPAG